MTGKRVALVTGAGRGIGRAITLALASDGVDVAIGARTAAEVERVAREVEELDREVEGLEGEVQGRAGRALAIELDVTSEASILAAFERCRDQLGAPTILVNNAGIAPSHKFLDIDPEIWSGVMDVNLNGAYLCTRAALPAMLEAGWGRIVNVASTAGKTGYRFTAAYTASKHGLLGLTRALAVELAGRGVTVNAVCPGFTRTKITDDAAAVIAHKTKRSAAEAESELERMSPMNRFVEPDEVARVVTFLARDASAGITGQAWNIDGGALAI